jgi:hypothetical protein
LFSKMEKRSAGSQKPPLCESGILLCVHCNIEAAPSAVVVNGLPGRRFDGDGYACAAAAVGST